MNKNTLLAEKEATTEVIDKLMHELNELKKFEFPTKFHVQDPDTGEFIYLSFPPRPKEKVDKNTGRMIPTDFGLLLKDLRNRIAQFEEDLKDINCLIHDLEKKESHMAGRKVGRKLKRGHRDFIESELKKPIKKHKISKKKYEERIKPTKLNHMDIWEKMHRNIWDKGKDGKFKNGLTAKQIKYWMGFSSNDYDYEVTAKVFGIQADSLKKIINYRVVKKLATEFHRQCDLKLENMSEGKKIIDKKLEEENLRREKQFIKEIIVVTNLEYARLNMKK